MSNQREAYPKAKVAWVKAPSRNAENDKAPESTGASFVSATRSGVRRPDLQREPPCMPVDRVERDRGEALRSRRVRALTSTKLGCYFWPNKTETVISPSVMREST